MANPVVGNNVVLYKYDDDTGESIPFACATNAQFAIDGSVVEVTNYNSAYWRQFIPDVNSFSLSGDGFVILNTQWNYRMLLDAIANREQFTVQFVIDNGTIEGLTIVAGVVMFTHVEITGGINAVATYAFQLQGTGVPTFAGTTVTPSGVIIVAGTAIQVFQLEATGGETTLTFPGTATLTAVYASRGGQTVQPLAYAGSPTPSNGAVWNTATGQLDIPTDNPAFPQERFLILAQ